MVQRNSHLEPFVRDKLFGSVYDSLKHRNTALSDATALTDTIVGKVIKHVNNGNIQRDTLTSVGYDVLKRFDKTAAIFYAAYHPSKAT